MIIDEGLKQFASEHQLKVIDAVNAAGGIRAGARLLGVVHSSVQGSLRNLRARAVLQDYSPEHDMTHVVPSPLMLKGLSTYYNSDGKPSGQWVKSNVNAAAMEQVMRDFVTDLSQGIKGKSPRSAAPKRFDKDFMVAFPMGDPHFGMYAWAAEAGDDFDTAVAERLTCAAIDNLIDRSPAAAVGLLLELGDLIHADNTTSRTPQSGANLDVDTRWAKVMQVALRAMVYGIKQMLKKFALVIVRFNKGNHDPHAALAIALAVEAYFHDDPRVIVDLSPAVHWYYRFGAVLVGSVHGDTNKADKLPGIMACDRAEDWGATRHRYWYCGHIHHHKLEEYPGAEVEYFRTLAPKDAWHAAQGYRAGRDMCAIVHHRDVGEYVRYNCDIGLL